MEDREKKISAIKSLLIDECAIPEKDIDVARNIFEGRNKLREKLYDLFGYGFANKGRPRS